MGLENRVCLVVGGCGDIGLAICRQMLESGATVIVSGMTKERVESARGVLAETGGSLGTAVLNVTDQSGCRTAVTDIVANHGRLDCLVNCAGISYIAPVLLGKVAEWQKVLNTNTLGSFIISQAALRPMIRQRSGRIVHIGSISAEVGAPFNAIYAASKAGVAAFVRSLALEVAGTGVTVNAVQPGYVRTKLFHQTQQARAKIKGVSLEQHEQDLIKDTPTRSLVTPEDVASLVCYLAAEESHSITGQMLNVDGGRTAR